MADPDSFEQGRRAFRAGNFEGAQVLFRTFLQVTPEDPECWFFYGAACHRVGQLETACEAFKRVSNLAPLHLESRLALASVYHALGEPLPALSVCKESALLAPDSPKVRFALAVAEEACGFLDSALDSYNQILAQTPSHVDALKNRGALLMALGRVDDAVANNRVLVSKQPYSYSAQFNLGDALIAQQSYKAAAETLGRALSLSPEHPKGLLHAAFALAQLGRFFEAQQLLDQVQMLDPEMVRNYRQSIFGDDSQGVLDARVLFLLRHYDAIERCDWRERDYFVASFSRLIRETSTVPLSEKALGFRAMAVGLNPDDLLWLAKQIAEHFRQVANQASSALPDKSLYLKQESVKPEKRERLRIGYLSGDFRSHATAYLMSKLPGLHDRNRFEIYLYSSGPDDGSEIRETIAVSADCFRDVVQLSDVALAQTIASDSIDILVDIGGYTQYSRPAALALRPAPVQVSYLAYLQTSGAPWIDYALMDHQVITAANRKGWTESIVYLPHTLYICNDEVVELFGSKTRTDVGLPEDAFVFCCLNSPWKIEPKVFSCWVKILERVPSAVLWLYANEVAAENNLREAFRVAGVDVCRIVFAKSVPHEQHLSRFRLADVFLDTFVCNAHTTAIEALAAGIPVVALLGESVAGRVGASLLNAHGLKELITRSHADYVELACRLAEDASFLRAMKVATENKEESHLFSTQQRVREIESAYEMMWERYVAALPPVDMNLPGCDAVSSAN